MGPQIERRTELLKVRMTPSEMAELDRARGAEERSDYVRRVLGGQKISDFNAEFSRRFNDKLAAAGVDLRLAPVDGPSVSEVAPLGAEYLAADPEEEFSEEVCAGFPADEGEHDTPETTAVELVRTALGVPNAGVDPDLTGVLSASIKQVEERKAATDPRLVKPPDRRHLARAGQKACIHGTAVGWNCFLCGGIAKVGQ